jgi:malto-oligosyltrehalose trehalohydrolase
LSALHLGNMPVASKFPQGEAPSFVRRQNLGFGAECRRDGVFFRVWAPHQRLISLRIEGRDSVYPMTAEDGGWHEHFLSGVGAGALYQFVLPDGLACPDPASRFQPFDVHGPSEVIDPEAYRWIIPDWRGRAWEECVLYELHVGSFTMQGTFLAAIERLDHLARLGVTAIELMPVGDFPGERNWGYDGVLPFAPDSSYGRPEDLKSLIDAAHARGIMVFLDVVYNHFGPVGNYLPNYGPILTSKHKTPWGPAVNFDAAGSEVVREFVIQNALYWIEEFYLDGLRLDAVHAMPDESSPHILEELAARAHAATGGRKIHLILENEENDSIRLRRDASGLPAEFTAQWNDDVHHVLHTAASGERDGYYIEYAGDTELLGRALAEGFAFQGQMMAYRGRPRGKPSAFLPPTAFVAFIQNHDQIGNRAFGDRITAFAPAAAVRAIAAIALLSPQIPMLFMGEEWAAAQPFPFFCDFPAELAESVRNGRRQEFSAFPKFQDPANWEKIPDPTDRSTFLSAKLHWEDVDSGAHAEQLEWYHRVIAVRRTEIVPRLKGIGERSASFEMIGDMIVTIRWSLADRSELNLVANLKGTAAPVSKIQSGRILWSEGTLANECLAPWSAIWSLSDGL